LLISSHTFFCDKVFFWIWLLFPCHSSASSMHILYIIRYKIHRFERLWIMFDLFLSFLTCIRNLLLLFNPIAIIFGLVLNFIYLLFAFFFCWIDIFESNKWLLSFRYLDVFKALLLFLSFVVFTMAFELIFIWAVVIGVFFKGYYLILLILVFFLTFNLFLIILIIILFPELIWFLD